MVRNIYNFLLLYQTFVQKIPPYKTEDAIWLSFDLEKMDKKAIDVELHR